MPGIRHPFHSGVADATDASLVRPSNWNSDHDIDDDAVTEAKLGLSDVTTKNVTTARHGLTPKLPNDATKYLDGTGAYTVPPGTGGDVTNPLSENLVTDDNLVKGADDANATGGFLEADAGVDGTAGGVAKAVGGDGATGKPGGDATLQGGRGDLGNDDPAVVVASAGDGAGNPGKLIATTDGSTGASGEALMSDGAGKVVWDTPAGGGASGGTPALVFDSSAAAGSAGTFIREDDQIALFDATAPSTQAFGDSAAVGSAGKAARRDHKHAMPANPVSLATPAIVLGSSAAAGAAGTLIRSDSTIAAFDATNPTTQAFSDSPAVGSAAFAARRDHKHGMPASPGGGSGQTTVKKTADESSSISGVQNDDELFFTGVLNAIYDIELILHWTQATGDNIRWDFSVPSGSVPLWRNDEGTKTLGTQVIDRSATPKNDSSSTAADNFQQYRGQVIMGGTGGTVQFRFGTQSGGGTSTLKKGSFLRYERVDS